MFCINAPPSAARIECGAFARGAGRIWLWVPYSGPFAGSPAERLDGVPMTTLVTRLMTWLHGERVGKDSLGNCYFQERAKPTGRRRRRWVIYDGEDEASRVPPSWHAWLHYTTSDVPDSSKAAPPIWQKEHKPNLTGTAGAYRPPGHTLEGGKRAPATGDYEPWRPQ